MDNYAMCLCATLQTVAYHIVDVVCGAFLILKKPASLVLAFLISMFVVTSLLSSTIDFARAKVAASRPCDWPLLSLLPACASPTPPAPERADFPGLLGVQHRALDGFLSQSNTGTELALDLKHAELAVQDLIVLVQASNLTIKDELSTILAEFVVDAKVAAQALHVLSSKLYSTIDRYDSIVLMARSRVE